MLNMIRILAVMAIITSPTVAAQDEYESVDTILNTLEKKFPDLKIQMLSPQPAEQKGIGRNAPFSEQCIRLAHKLYHNKSEIERMISSKSYPNSFRHTFRGDRIAEAVILWARDIRSLDWNKTGVHWCRIIDEDLYFQSQAEGYHYPPESNKVFERIFPEFSWGELADFFDTKK